MWYNANWKYRKKITIDHTKVSGNTDLANFPVLISLTDLNLKTRALPTGADIVITDQYGTKLDYEIESYDSATGELIAWVRVPTLRATVNTPLYIYYGNPQATDQQNPSGVWDSNYLGVWHLKENPGGAGAQMLDSTSNNRDATSTGSMTQADQVDGQIDGGLDLDGTDDALTVPHAAALNAYPLTVSFWINTRDNRFPPGVINKYFPGSSNGYNIYIDSGNIKAWYFKDASNKVYDGGNGIDGGSIRNGAWRYVTFIVDASGGNILVDAVSQATLAWSGTPGAPTTTEDLTIGEYPNTITPTTENLLGLLDEIRISNVARSSDWITTEYNNQSAPTEFFTVGTQEKQAVIQKHFIYRIYDDNTYVATWTKEVLSEPKFKTTINGGPGELTIELARPFDDFGEDVDVKLNNKVECWCVDKDNPNGVLMYAGYISGYKPMVKGVTEKVIVTVFGYIAEFQRIILRDGSGNTTVTYNSYDPSDILTDVIDKYRALGGSLNYAPGSIKRTNTTVSYTFNTNTVKECLDKIIELCPDGWFWRVDPDGIVYLSNRNLEADHTFTLGLDVEDLETFRRIEDVVNTVFFTGAGDPALFKLYENSGSRDSYGPYEKKMVDQRVSVDNTASVMSNREITSKKDPEIRSIFVIIDNNGPTDRGQNIENVKPGQTLKVNNLKAAARTISLWDVALWDTDVWDQTLTTSAADVIQILSVDYEPDSIVIEASSRLPQIAKRIEDIQRNLEVTQLVNNPAAPS